jgi:hypothetical protein
MRDLYQSYVDHSVSLGNTAAADRHLQFSAEHNKQAQQIYEQMAAHGHPDFPAAMNQQRQNYNPANSGYHP